MPTKPTVAYFSAEYAIADDLPIYAGGLGILAADIVLEAGRGQAPFYAMGLVYHHAFTGDDADQRPMTERLGANGFTLVVDEHGQRRQVEIGIDGRQVKVQAWSKAWGPATLVLLDTHIGDNAPADQAICDHLYASDLELELAQEICLGFGGVAMLEAMGIKPDVYHLNEGHTAMAGLAVVLSEQRRSGSSFGDAVAATRPKLVGTKHTILAGAGIVTPEWDLIERQLGHVLAAYGDTVADLRPLAHKTENEYSDTKLLLSLVHKASGVAKIHVAAEHRDHPESHLIAITNGVSRERWIAPSWDGKPLDYSDEKIWSTHRENRLQLLDYVREQDQTEMNPDTLTVVWARRMTAYKQPGLLVGDLDRLDKLINHSSHPVQFIVAGKPNPADVVGIELMNRIVEASHDQRLARSLAYLPHYNPASARLLVRGADLWLNTPIRGYEACGTSGMKASLNGAVQLSTSDGWIDEVDSDKIGWILPERAKSHQLYDILEHDVAPLYYARRDNLPLGWIKLMRANMALIQDHFTAERMLADYYKQLYSA
jgi:starch phosphorylase